MTAFWIGFLSGLVANWFFGLLPRILPPTWVRYDAVVQDCSIQDYDSLAFDVVVSLILQPPRWKSILIPPLREQLGIILNLDNHGWVRGKWVEGDVNSNSIFAEGLMTASSLILNGHHGAVYLGDAMGTSLQDGRHKLEGRVFRLIDKKTAAAMSVEFVVTHGSIEKDSLELTK